MTGKTANGTPLTSEEILLATFGTAERPRTAAHAIQFHIQLTIVSAISREGQWGARRNCTPPSWKQHFTLSGWPHRPNPRGSRPPINRLFGPRAQPESSGAFAPFCHHLPGLWRVSVAARGSPEGDSRCADPGLAKISGRGSGYEFRIVGGGPGRSPLVRAPMADLHNPSTAEVDGRDRPSARDLRRRRLSPGTSPGVIGTAAALASSPVLPPSPKRQISRRGLGEPCFLINLWILDRNTIPWSAASADPSMFIYFDSSQQVCAIGSPGAEPHGPGS